METTDGMFGWFPWCVSCALEHIIHPHNNPEEFFEDVRISLHSCRAHLSGEYTFFISTNVNTVTRRLPEVDLVKNHAKPVGEIKQANHLEDTRGLTFLIYICMQHRDLVGPIRNIFSLDAYLDEAQRRTNPDILHH